jgi:hypothetical protein
MNNRAIFFLFFLSVSASFTRNDHAARVRSKFKESFGDAAETDQVLNYNFLNKFLQTDVGTCWAQMQKNYYFCLTTFDYLIIIISFKITDCNSALQNIY